LEKEDAANGPIMLVKIFRLNSL